MRIVLTGAGGGLGRAFVQTCPSHHDVVTLAHADLDVGDHHAVMRLVPDLEPDLIVNAAAFTDVDGCEADPDRAYRDNALGPQSLALAARSCGARLVHVSTDYVFDGERGVPYDELDPPNPVNVYGRSKLAGERFVRELAPESFVVRTAWVFGGGTDRVTRSLARLREGETAGAIVDRTGSPTYVRHLAERLLPLVLTSRPGVYHLAGPEPTTWFDLIARARELGGLPGILEEQRADELGLKAPRPRSSALVSRFVHELGIPPMPPLDDALADLLGSDGGSSLAG